MCALLFPPLKATGQFVQNLREMNRMFPRNVLTKGRRLQPLSADTHLLLVEGHCQGYAFRLCLQLARVLLAS